MIDVAGRPRSLAEMQFFLELAPCPRCGARDISTMRFATADVDGETFGFYEGPCAQCGAERRYRFGAPRSLAPVADLSLGGPEPSEILSADALRAAAEAYLAEVADDPAGLDEKQRLAAWKPLRRAVTALRELAKVPDRARPDDDALRARAEALHDRYRARLAPREAAPSLSRADLLAMDPVAAVAALRADRPDSPGDLACLEQLRAAGVPREALELTIAAWSAALDGLSAGPVPADRLARLDRATALQTSGMPALARWTSAWRTIIASAQDLDRAIRFFLRVRQAWQLAERAPAR